MKLLRNLATLPLRLLTAAGSWLLQAPDVPACRWANVTGEDDAGPLPPDPWPECRESMERINQRVRDGYYTSPPSDPPF